MTGAQMLADSTRRVLAFRRQRDPVLAWGRRILYAELLAATIFLGASVALFDFTLHRFYEISTGQTLTRQVVLNKIQSWLRVYPRPAGREAR